MGSLIELPVGGDGTPRQRRRQVELLGGGNRDVAFVSVPLVTYASIAAAAEQFFHFGPLPRGWIVESLGVIFASEGGLVASLLDVAASMGAARMTTAAQLTAARSLFDVSGAPGEVGLGCPLNGVVPVTLPVMREVLEGQQFVSARVQNASGDAVVRTTVTLSLFPWR